MKINQELNDHVHTHFSCIMPSLKVTQLLHDCGLSVCTKHVQWNLRITDKLGAGILSFIEKLSEVRTNLS